MENKSKELFQYFEKELENNDKELDTAVKAVFAPNFQPRLCQVALIKLVHQKMTGAKIVVAEWPCAAGKSSVIAIRGNFLCS